MRNFSKIVPFAAFIATLLYTSFFTETPVKAGQIVEESSSIDSGSKSYDSEYSPAPPPSSKQSIKDSAKQAVGDAVGSIIGSVGEKVGQSIREGNNTATKQQSYPDERPSRDSNPNPYEGGRRPKERRY